MIVKLALGFGATIVTTGLLLAVLAVLLGRKAYSTRELLALVPNMLRLVRRLLVDPAVPRGARWRLRVAFVYSVQPINLIPDFVPVIGFTDNVVVLCWGLRSTIQRCGDDVIIRHWAGTQAELNLLYRLGRLGAPPSLSDNPAISS